MYELVTVRQGLTQDLENWVPKIGNILVKFWGVLLKKL